MKLKSAWTLIFAVVLLGLVGGFVLFRSGSIGEEEYRSFSSPDGQFRIVVFRKRSLAAAMPGQSGDSPGVVKLYDRKGRVLQTTKVEMAQLVDQVEWEPHRVIVKLVADWDLPRQ